MIIEDFAKNLVKKSKYHVQQEAYEHICIAMIAGLLGNIVRSKEEKLYANIYSTLVGNTNQGKSSYAKTIRNYISQIQIKKNRLHSLEYKKKKTIIDEENNGKKKKDQGEVEINPNSYSDDIYYQPRSYYVDDMTIEAALEQAATNSWGNMFLFKDELGGFFDSFTKKGREEDQTTYNSLYQPGDTFEVKRKSKESKIPIIYYPVMNIMGCTTKETIEEILESYQKKGRKDGTFSRFQHIYILPEQKRSDLDFKNVEEVKDDFDEDFIGFCLAIINRQIFIGKRKKIQESGEDYLENDFITYLARNAHAEDRLIEYATSINDERYNHDDILYKEHLGRHIDYVIKLSLIYHLQIRYKLGQNLWEDENILIDEYSMSKAIEKAKESKKHASSLYGVGYDYCKSLHEESLLILKYIKNKSEKFYQKNKDNNLWTVRDLARTMAKVLPRKINKGINMDLLEELLNHLVELGELYSFEKQLPNGKHIDKYSFDKPSEPLPTNKLSKQTEHSVLQAIQYPTKEENTAHIEKLKSSVNVREFIRQYIKLKNKGLSTCPFHNDKTPSFSAMPDYFNCFGCGASGSAIDFVMMYNKSDFGEAVKTLESYTNIRLEPKTSRLIDKIAQEATLKANEAPYLKNRLGYDLPLNDSISYSKSVYYKDNEYIANYPAMIAKITDNQGEFIGLHRAYLNDDMSHKRDLGNRPSKKILGRLDGGYVNLIDNAENKTLIIGEGIETVLSLYILLTNSLSSLYDDKLTSISVYANLSATNIPDLPKNDKGDYRFTKIIIAQDNDIAGMRYISLMKEKYHNLQIEVRTPREYNDFNDFLLNK